MAKKYVADCGAGTLSIQDLTPEEEAQQARDRATHTERLAAEQTAKDQRSADIATLRQGPAALGYAEALLRVIRKR